MGAVTPLGHSVDELFAALIEGQSGAAPITRFDAKTFPTKFAAEVKNFDLARLVPKAERWRHAGFNSQFSAAATLEALRQADLLENAPVDRTRFGIYLGSGEGMQDFTNVITLIARNYQPATRTVDTVGFTRDGLERFHARRELEQDAHTNGAHLADHFELLGPNLNCLTACAASSQAVGEATELIRHGDADLMLSGGAHSMIHPFGVTGFNLLTALSTYAGDPKKASRPFDLHREGFVLGEGAAMLVLEELEHAKRRKASILGEIQGYGTTCDAFRVTDSHPEGRGAIACINMALADSGIAPEEIGYINAHGTSTQVNDRVETLAIKQTLGAHAYQVPVSSSKSMLGHLIGAAGAVELIISLMALKRGILPPTINYETPDPECDLDYIPNAAREKRVRHALSNSFGFGGQNVSLIVSRYDE
jgi:3-oxoacyl-[acyl-carrier-protein] synthase II